MDDRQLLRHAFKNLFRFNVIESENAISLPENVKLTVYSKSKHGFMFNVYSHEINTEALVFTHWMLQSDFDKL